MSGGEAPTGFAFWETPSSSIAVHYSLPLFHEIDFTVNEGFRRIPHGGVEVGGVLFGRLEERITWIEQTRPIQCEYAHGPSFNLSEQDVSALRQQIAAEATDPELEGLTPMGWFIGHTRHPLQLGEQEAALFEELFPQAGQLTVLVKPERFKATIFGFIVRSPDLRYQNDASPDAFILPLPARTDSAEPAEPKRSIPAPVMEEAEPTRDPVSVSSVPFPEAVPAAAMRVERAEVLPSLHEIQKRRLEKLPNSNALDTGSRTWTSPRQPKPWMASGSSRRAVLIGLPLLLSIALIAYWSYLQLYGEPIPLRVEVSGSKMIVDWPEVQTSRLPLATLQVGEQPPVPLTPQQKRAGQAEIEIPGNDVRIELVIHHWYQDRRGILHFSKAPPAPTPPIKGRTRGR